MTREVQILASIINALGAPKKIPTRPPKYRRAAVAIIIRIRSDHAWSAHASKPGNHQQPQQPQQPSQSKQPPHLDSQYPESLDEFFAQPWVQSGVPEILFIERANRRATDHRWTGHVALPGGKQVSSLDEDDQETAARETTEEIGLDLADPTLYRCVGQLDDRELWTSFGRVFLMVLAPFGKTSTNSTDIQTCRHADKHMHAFRRNNERCGSRREGGVNDLPCRRHPYFDEY